MFYTTAPQLYDALEIAKIETFYSCVQEAIVNMFACMDNQNVLMDCKYY